MFNLGAVSLTDVLVMWNQPQNSFKLTEWNLKIFLLLSGRSVPWSHNTGPRGSRLLCPTLRFQFGLRPPHPTPLQSPQTSAGRSYLRPFGVSDGTFQESDGRGLFSLDRNHNCLKGQLVSPMFKTKASWRCMTHQLIPLCSWKRSLKHIPLVSPTDVRTKMTSRRSASYTLN